MRRSICCVIRLLCADVTANAMFTLDDGGYRRISSTAGKTRAQSHIEEEDLVSTTVIIRALSRSYNGMRASANSVRQVVTHALG